jgi:hypothetical protein
MYRIKIIRTYLDHYNWELYIHTRRIASSDMIRRKAVCFKTATKVAKDLGIKKIEYIDLEQDFIL